MTNILKLFLFTPYASLFSLRLTQFDPRHFFAAFAAVKSKNKTCLLLSLFFCFQYLICSRFAPDLKYTVYINVILSILSVDYLIKYWSNNFDKYFLRNCLFINSCMQLLDLLLSTNPQEVSLFYLDSNFFGLSQNCLLVTLLLRHLFYTLPF